MENKTKSCIALPYIEQEKEKITQLLKQNNLTPSCKSFIMSIQKESRICNNLKQNISFTVHEK